MTGVIVGLVAVVLLVLVVVALGMRSMNRRESALSSERIKAMAEGKGSKSRRPAEETFFESFPKDFDAFEEPAERAASKQRAGGARPAPRPGGRQAARPAQRGSKQPTAPRGRRGVDEWGEPDDYDDDYWTRVRADDGGFGGTIAARMAAPRPVAQTADSPGNGMVDADAVTVQAPLPQRPVAAGRADAAEPRRAPASSVIAEQKTVTFSAPTPDLLSAAGAPAGSPSRPDPLSPTTGPSRATPANAGNSAKPTSAAQTFETDPFFAPRSTGPFESPRTSGSFPPARGTGPVETTPPVTPAPSTGPYPTPRTSGTFPPAGGTGPFETTPPAAAPAPAAATFAGPSTGSFEAIRGTGPFETTAPSIGSFEKRPAPEPPRADSYDATRNVTGPFSADTGPSYVVPATASEPAAYAAPPSASPAPPPAAAPGWSGARDVLDDPEPPRNTSSWPSWPSGGESHKPSAPAPYDGYSSSYSSEKTYSSEPASYEVSAGWATIDVSDTVTGPSPAMGVPTGPSRTVSPYEQASYDSGAGRGQYGYDPQGYGAAEQPVTRPEQDSGGGWPSYDELYGNTSETSTRRGSHRNPENDYPDYYR
jgi:hypothetical protein